MSKHWIYTFTFFCSWATIALIIGGRGLFYLFKAAKEKKNISKQYQSITQIDIARKKIREFEKKGTTYRWIMVGYVLISSILVFIYLYLSTRYQH